MVKHVIKGKTCKIAIDIPGYWDDSTKNVIIQIMKYCLEEDKQREIIGSVNHLVELENKLMEALKAVGQYSGVFEKNARDLIGLNLNHGFAIGSNYSLAEMAKMDIADQMTEYKTLVEQLPTENMTWVIAFYSFYLGRLAYETGFMLGTYISKERVEEYKEELQRDMSYVG